MKSESLRVIRHIELVTGDDLGRQVSGGIEISGLGNNRRNTHIVGLRLVSFLKQIRGGSRELGQDGTRRNHGLPTILRRCEGAMSRDDTRRTLICYDIINDRRRTRIADALSEFGDRVQYSVFVVDISPARLLQVKSRLNTIIDPGEDSILFCDLGRVAELSETKFGYLGKSREVTDNDALIL